METGQTVTSDICEIFRNNQVGEGIPLQIPGWRLDYSYFGSKGKGVPRRDKGMGKLRQHKYTYTYSYLQKPTKMSSQDDKIMGIIFFFRFLLFLVKTMDDFYNLNM